MSIGQNIKNARAIKGISQKELASMLNIPPSTLANYENNHRKPSIFVLQEISSFLDTNIDILTGNSPELNIKEDELENNINCIMAFKDYLKAYCKKNNIDEDIPREDIFELLDLCNVIIKAFLKKG